MCTHFMRFSNGRGWRNLGATGIRCSQLEDTRKGGKKWKEVLKSFVIFFPQANFPGEKLPGRLPDDNKRNVISILETSPPRHEGKTWWTSWKNFVNFLCNNLRNSSNWETLNNWLTFVKKKKEQDESRWNSLNRNYSTRKKMAD